MLTICVFSRTMFLYVFLFCFFKFLSVSSVSLCFYLFYLFLSVLISFYLFYLFSFAAVDIGVPHSSFPCQPILSTDKEELKTLTFLCIPLYSKDYLQAKICWLVLILPNPFQLLEYEMVREGGQIWY